MQKREISNLDRLEIGEQEKAHMTAKNGRKGYSSKSSRASKPSRKKDGRVSGGKKQRGGQRQTVYKLADLLTVEEIERLKGLK